MMTYNVFPDLYDKNITVKVMNGIGANPQAWTQYFNQTDEHVLSLKTAAISGLGRVPQWHDGTDLPLDEAYDISDLTITQVFYGMGFKISRKMGPAPEGYGQITLVNKLAAALSRSADQTYGIVHVQTLDNAFTTTLASLGTKTLCSATHLTVGAGTRSNLGSAAALTPANLFALELKAAAWVNFRGLNDPIDLSGAKLIFPSALRRTAEKIVGSNGEPFMMDNDKNVHQNKYQLIEEVRLTSTTAYFLQFADHGMVSNHGLRPIPISYYENNGSLVKGLQFDFATGVEKPDGIFGSAGA